MRDVVETKRLLLRRWQGRDEEELVRLFGDPAVQSGRVLPANRVRAIHVSGLRQWQEYGCGPWAAVDKEAGQWICGAAPQIHCPASLSTAAQGPHPYSCHWRRPLT